MTGRSCARSVFPSRLFIQYLLQSDKMSVGGFMPLT